MLLSREIAQEPPAGEAQLSVTSSGKSEKLWRGVNGISATGFLINHPTVDIPPTKVDPGALLPVLIYLCSEVLPIPSSTQRIVVVVVVVFTRSPV